LRSASASKSASGKSVEFVRLHVPQFTHILEGERVLFSCRLRRVKALPNLPLEKSVKIVKNCEFHNLHTFWKHTLGRNPASKTGQHSWPNGSLVRASEGGGHSQLSAVLLESGAQAHRSPTTTQGCKLLLRQLTSLFGVRPKTSLCRLMQEQPLVSRAQKPKHIYNINTHTTYINSHTIYTNTPTMKHPDIRYFCGRVRHSGGGGGGIHDNEWSGMRGNDG